MKRAAACAIALLLSALIGTVAIPLARSAELTDDEFAQCAAQGGCWFVTLYWFRDRIREAMQEGFDAGLERGRQACFKSTS